MRTARVARILLSFTSPMLKLRTVKHLRNAPQRWASAKPSFHITNRNAASRPTLTNEFSGNTKNLWGIVFQATGNSHHCGILWLPKLVKFRFAPHHASQHSPINLLDPPRISEVISKEAANHTPSPAWLPKLAQDLRFVATSGRKHRFRGP